MIVEIVDVSISGTERGMFETLEGVVSDVRRKEKVNSIVDVEDSR